MATELTAAQLRAYDGSDASKPIYVSISGKVYDVSAGRGFYGPGGDYALFAGREASRALAKMSKESANVSGDLSGLSDKELGAASGAAAWSGISPRLGYTSPGTDEGDEPHLCWSSLRFLPASSSSSCPCSPPWSFLGRDGRTATSSSSSSAAPGGFVLFRFCLGAVRWACCRDREC